MWCGYLKENITLIIMKWYTFYPEKDMLFLNYIHKIIYKLKSGHFFYLKRGSISIPSFVCFQYSIQKYTSFFMKAAHFLDLKMKPIFIICQLNDSVIKKVLRPILKHLGKSVVNMYVYTIKEILP